MLEENQKAKVDYYIGTIVEVLDPVLYEIRCDIPGVFDGVKAFPIRGEVDEPRVGDFVILKSFDPVYHSYFLYQKLKENDFIGFRSNGKMIDITPDYIEMCIFDPEENWNDDQGDEKYRPTATTWIQLDKGGNLKISLNGENSKIDLNCSGNTELKMNGNVKIWSGGNTEIEASGNLTLKAGATLNFQGPVIKFSGGGQVIMNGTAMPGTPGPFIIPPTAPAPGTTPISSSTVQLNE